MRFTDKEAYPNELSPLNLAFIGDCVYEMLVRESLVLNANRPVNDLHRESVKYVSAKAQTLAYDKIKDMLTEQEIAVYKRGFYYSKVLTIWGKFYDTVWCYTYVNIIIFNILNYNQNSF